MRQAYDYWQNQPGNYRCYTPAPGRTRDEPDPRAPAPPERRGATRWTEAVVFNLAGAAGRTREEQHPHRPTWNVDRAPARRRPSRGHPIAPTEFFKGRSAPEARSAGANAHYPETATYGPQKEDTEGRSHRRIDGYRSRLTPRSLDRIFAKGQSSTDLIHTQSTQVFGSFSHQTRPPRGGRMSRR